MTTRCATIIGVGIAGLTAARLLSLCGWRVVLVGTTPDLGRWVTLSSQTRRLIEDFWGCEVLGNATTFSLQGRNVMWSGDEPVRVAEPLLAIETSSLARAMLHRLTTADGSGTICHLADRSPRGPEALADGPVIDARGRYGSPQAKRMQHGSRSMRVWRSVCVEGPLAPFGEVYAGRGFWSFAFPIEANCISLQIATPKRCPIDEFGDLVRAGLSDKTPLLTSALGTTPDLFERDSTEVSTAPSLLLKDPSSGCMAIGDALMTLDPLCGDGTGHGIKSALLAVGVLNSVSGTIPEEAVLSHYVGRAHYAYKTHLEHCHRYYSSMRYSTYWVDEVEDPLPVAFARFSTKNSCSTLKLVVAGIGENNVAATINPSIKLILTTPFKA